MNISWQALLAPRGLLASVDWLEALVLGLIQGLTEWLPVSSSGHLAIAQRYLGEVPVVVDILLHFGTMLVLLVYFRKEGGMVLRSAGAVLRDLSRGTGWGASINKDAERRLSFLIVLALVPTAMFALAFRYLFGEGLFSNLTVIAAGFAVTGAMLVLCGIGKRGARKDADLTARDSLAVGAAQGIAFLPGFSRSGLTIATGMLRGLEPETAGRYSFLIMLPAVLGSMILSLPDLGALSFGMIMMGLAGMAVAMAVGWLSLGLLMRILKKGAVHWFAPYCFAACAFTVMIAIGYL
jgi:undecaprenyl-diphosphatase